ncbi:hypothetical protein WH50_22665 [Pokkaliibacter plantistimulans]|uniref:Crp/Fnr family transcriptional regulator n=2 Tax=Pokkaliibacter plantistimulans TaxID=1635171 RepID=A0ABX5LR35_9GAMM|nr:hypothetical protein WH50_22665 [Pokkaliibacter plantistimulans]
MPYTPASYIAPETSEDNSLLDMLPTQDRYEFKIRSEKRRLEMGEVLHQEGKHTDTVYFPVSGLISQVSQVDTHPPLEMNLIGHEGMLGASILLGEGAAPLTATVQSSGLALCMETAGFIELLEHRPTLQRLLQKYLYITLQLLARNAACNCFHSVSQRLARWLLMIHDRSSNDQFYLTQEFLSDMLGVRRSSITVAAVHLQRKGLIHYSRGEIRILNRNGLEALACGCYQTMAEYHQILSL